MLAVHCEVHIEDKYKKIVVQTHGYSISSALLGNNLVFFIEIAIWPYMLKPDYMNHLANYYK